MIYLPTKLGDFVFGQMLVCMFQHHGAFGIYNPFPVLGFSDIVHTPLLAMIYIWIPPADSRFHGYVRSKMSVYKQN